MAAAPPTPSPRMREVLRETALAAWRSSRVLAAVLLAAAVILGARVRLHDLARADMSADEAASWAAAVEPGVCAVVVAEQRLDPGKLALYDLLLHGWIGVFGDGLFAMRAMSAALGTLAIVLVFAAVREVFRALGDDSAAALGEAAGAFAALIYALNLEMVLSDRTVRMYPLVMVAELSQIMFLMRAQRRGGLVNYAAVAIFTAMMVAANFTASFLLVAEGLWLGCLLLARFAGARRAAALAIFSPAAAIAAGVALLGPMLPAAAAASAAAVQYGAINWIKLQPVWWPYTTLRGAAGSHSTFRVLAALGVFGVCWRWASTRLASGFLAAWMLGPLAAVMAVTYLVRPLEFPRYVIISSVALFAFAGLGAAAPRSTAVRIVLAVLLVHLSLRPLRHWLRHRHEAAWSEATALAARHSAPNATIAVFPDFAVNVVRYYLPPARRAATVGVLDQCGAAQVLILSGRRIYPEAKVAAIQACYPHLVARLRKVEVRTR